MSWAGLASNQTVSFNNLQNAVSTGYFYALAAIPSSQEQITKADASTYVSIDTAYAPYAAKASNQLVVKSNLKPIFQYSGTFYYVSGPEPIIGWDSSVDACINYSSASSLTVNWNGSLGVGTFVFIPSCLIDITTLPYYVIVYSGTAYWVTLLDEYYDPTTNTCAYSITNIGTCSCEITITLLVDYPYGGGFITVTNQSTFVDYTITAADATGVGVVPDGSYVVTSFGLNNSCPAPLSPYVSPSSFSGGCYSNVTISIGCN
jgi:hypothetical protein